MSHSPSATHGDTWSREDIIDGLKVISRKRGENVGLGDVIVLVAAIRFLEEQAQLSEIAPSDSEWQRRYEEEWKIVDRCWRALGITTYEAANGKAIDELIKERCAPSATRRSDGACPTCGLAQGIQTGPK